MQNDDEGSVMDSDDDFDSEEDDEGSAMDSDDNDDGDDSDSYSEEEMDWKLALPVIPLIWFLALVTASITVT